MTWTDRLPHISPAKIDLFTISRIAIWDLQPWQATCKCQHSKGRRMLIKRGREFAGATVNRVLGLSLAESLPGKKSSLSSSCWVLLLSQGMRAPPSGLLTLFNWGFCLSHFYKANIFLPFLMYAFLISLSKFDLGCVLSMNSSSFTWLLKQCKTFKSFRYIDTVKKTALYWSLSLYFKIIFLRQLYRDS